MKVISLKKSLKTSQSGAVLAFCLVFLVVLTVIAVGGMETTVMEERMAGNMQDYNVAFQSAESSLEAAELWLANLILLPEMRTVKRTAGVTVWNIAGLDPNQGNNDNWWEERARSWWGSNAEAAAGISGVASQPEYIIEQYFQSDNRQSINVGTGEEVNQKTYHRVTARGLGGSGTNQVMLQTTYVRPYD